MKIRLVISVIIVFFVGISCSINKRAHRPGYNVEWHSAQPKPQKNSKSEELEMAKVERDEPNSEVVYPDEILPGTNKEAEILAEDNIVADGSSSGLFRSPNPTRSEYQFIPRLKEKSRTNAIPEKAQELTNADQLAVLGFWFSLGGVLLSVALLLISVQIGVIFPMLVPIILIVLGIGFSHKSLSKMRTNPTAYKNRGLAIAGLVIGYTGILVWILSFLTAIWILAWS